MPRLVQHNAKGPVEIKSKDGQSFWICQCGLSRNQPYCDGSHKKTLDEANVKPEDMIDLLKLFEEKKITDNTTKEAMIKLITEKNFSPKIYIEENNLIMKSDILQIEVWCKKAIGEFSDAVESYKNGNERSLNFLVGKVMQLSHKTANPDVARKILVKFIKK